MARNEPTAGTALIHGVNYAPDSKEEDMVGGTAPPPAVLGTALIHGVNYVPDSEEEEVVDDGSTAPPPAMLGTALVRGVNYVPDSEEEDIVDDGGGAMKLVLLGKAIQVDESEVEAIQVGEAVQVGDEHLPWEDEEEAQALLMLASTPTDVFMLNLCRHEAFMIMGPRLILAYFGASDFDIREAAFIIDMIQNGYHVLP